MSKKFFDIIPPDKVSSSKREIVLVGEKSQRDKLKERGKEFSRKTKELSEKIEAVVEKKMKRSPKFGRVFLKISFFCLLFLVLVAVPAILLFSKPEVKIWPETRILNLEETVTVDLNQKESNPQVWLETKIIPGELFEDWKAASQEFSATGQTEEEQKARGIIRVYNNHSTASQPLLINTRFVSSDGKLFKSVKAEVIAAGLMQGGRLIAGETDIEVVASEPGEDYNIGPSTFSIPGFAGTPKYTTFYGKSFSPMVGGSKGKVSQVTQEDIDKARDSLALGLKKQSKDFLTAALAQGFVLLDKAVFQEVKEEGIPAKAGTVADSFLLHLKVVSSAFIFKESDANNFAKALIGRNISEGEKIQENSLEISFSPELFAKKDEEGAIDIESGKMLLDLKIKVRVYQDVDLDELKRNLAGKSKDEIEVFLGSQPGIVKEEVKTGPFWRSKLPEDIDKFEIYLNIE